MRSLYVDETRPSLADPSPSDQGNSDVVRTLDLRGQRVALRDFGPDDVTAVRVYHSDPEVMRFLPAAVKMNQTPAAIRTLLRDANADAISVPRFKYDLAVTVDGEVVGAARLHQESSESAEGEIGYILRRDMWGRGFGTETAHLLLALGFTEIGLDMVRAIVERANVGSIRVLQKLGMRPDGELEERRQLVERRSESFIYVLRRDDWERQRARRVE